MFLGKEVVREWYASSIVYKPRKNPKMYSANINSGKRTCPYYYTFKTLSILRFLPYIAGVTN